MQMNNPVLIAKAARMQNCSLGLMEAVMVMEKQLLGGRTYDNFPSCIYNVGIKESIMWSFKYYEYFSKALYVIF